MEFSSSSSRSSSTCRSSIRVDHFGRVVADCTACDATDGHSSPPPPPPTKRPVTQENGQVEMDVTGAGYFTGVGMQCRSALSQSISAMCIKFNV